MAKRKSSLDSQPAVTFGSYLIGLRKQAGSLSQDEVVRRAAAASGRGPNPLSKSALSLYERGNIQSLRPDIAKLLSDIYQVRYEELVSRWVQETYGTNIAIEHDSFVSSASRDECILRGPLDEDEVPIVSVDYLRRTQEALPVGSEVGVATIAFLDNDVYFDMVSANIKRGIRYFYLMPEDERISYKVFVSRLAQRFPELKRKLDGNLTNLIVQSPSDFPRNFVIYLLPNGLLQGYVGLLYDRRAQYFQAADPALTLRLYQSFSTAITISEDSSLNDRLQEVYRTAGRLGLKKKRLSLTKASE